MIGKKNKVIGRRKTVLRNIILAWILGIAALYYFDQWISSVITIIVSFFLLTVYSIAKEKLAISTKIKKIESVFPDFLQLMATNLKAGMTIDKALLASSRKEFAPLDYEINQVGKDLITGMEIDNALANMGKRINSPKIKKIISLLVSGIRSGGDVASLLEQTASNMRERSFVEKKAASNVLMYVIFIVFAVCVGAPFLFALSSLLVEILTNILSGLPTIEATRSLPFSLTKINVSVDFINYFSLFFLVVSNIMGALIIGLVSRGEEKEGIRYIIPLVSVAVIVFIVVRFFLRQYLSGLLG